METANLYLWLKALHIMAVISWMAGMLYLPRLFVYHAQRQSGSEASEMLKLMERRLLRYIINPAMILTFLFGLGLIHIVGFTGAGMGWLHVKIALVLVLAGIHGMLARYRKAFEKDANTRSPRFYKILNETVTLLMVVIVLLAVLKPF